MREKDLIPLEKKYIEVQYDADSQKLLQEYCTSNGFDIEVSFDREQISDKEFDFHTTVWYTTTEHQLANGQHDIVIDDVEPLGFALFGENENVLVLEIKSEKLLSIRHDFQEQYDMEDEWPDYRPHISLTYNYDGNEIPNIDFPDTSQLAAYILNIKTQKD